MNYLVYCLIRHVCPQNVSIFDDRTKSINIEKNIWGERNFFIIDVVGVSIIHVYSKMPGNKLLYRGNVLLKVCNICTRWQHNVVGYDFLYPFIIAPFHVKCGNH